MPESGTYGSVRGAAGNSRPYRESNALAGATEPMATVTAIKAATMIFIRSSPLLAALWEPTAPADLQGEGTNPAAGSPCPRLP
jgi:hypothetical protein